MEDKKEYKLKVYEVKSEKELKEWEKKHGW
jgi:hypothetical protein